MSFKTPTVEYDDSNFKAAFHDYCDLKKNVDPATELKRRAVNVGYKLVKIFVATGAQKEQIVQQLKSLGFRVRIRSKLALKGRMGGISRKRLIALETKARANAAGFTATGWFTAIKRLGGDPKRAMKRNIGGPERGDLKKSMGLSSWIELINMQPAAALVGDRDGGATQKALDDERDDMLVYVFRKLDQTARRNGL